MSAGRPPESVVATVARELAVQELAMARIKLHSETRRSSRPPGIINSDSYSSPLRGGPPIDGRLRDLGQQLVRVLLLFEVLLRATG